MQTIKINGIEIQFEDGLDLSIEDGGKRIIVKGKGVIAPIMIPYISYPYQPSTPINPLYPTWLQPSITCSQIPISTNTYQATGLEQVTFTQ